MKKIILLAFILAVSVSGYAFGATAEPIIYVVGEENIPSSYQEFYDNGGYDDDGNIVRPAYVETLGEALDRAETFAGTESDFENVIIILQTNIDDLETIELDGSNYGSLSSITINGNGKRITLQEEGFRHFRLAYSETAFTLQNATLNGNSTGGGIYISDGTAVFTNVTFRNCSAIEDDDGNTNGGAVFITDRGDAAFTGCIFTSNNASNGGAVFTANRGTATLTGCTFQSNKASNGGAIYASSSETLTIADNNTFSGNYSEAGNGGALFVASGQTVKFSGTNTFNGNYTESGNGGAVYVDGTGKITNENSTVNFEGNYTNYEISENDAQNFSDFDTGYGGALCMAGTESIEFGNVTFTNNKAILGGSIFIAYLSSENDSYSYSYLNIYRPSFIKSSGTINFTGSVSMRTGSASDGGAVFMSGGTINFTGSAEFISNEAKNHGGALYITGSPAAMNFSQSPVFSRNKANSDNGLIGDGGAVWWDVEVSKFASTFPANTRFNGNSTAGTSPQTEKNNAGNGGAIYISQSGTLTLDSSSQYTFSENTAYNNGGAIYTKSADVTINGTEFSDKNSASVGNGGFVCSGSGNISIQNSAISNQEAQNGGAVHAVNIAITGSVFNGNSAVTEGGAIYVAENGTLTVSDSEFTKNSSSNGGGAIITDTATVKITETVFSGNTAKGNGGAVFTASKCDTTITNCTFESNQAVNGGALRGNGTLKIEKSYFEGNNASSEGGAVYFNQIPGESSFAITSSMLRGNSAGGASDGKGGGALWLSVNDIEIDSCTFDNNIIAGGSTAYGGAVYLDTSSSTSANNSKIINSTFTSNKAMNGTSQNYGGAVYLLGRVNITSCAFTLNNSAKDRGGALYIAGAKAVISGTIIAGNSAPLGADVFSEADSDAYWSSSGYNRIGVYALPNGTTSWLAHPAPESDKENSSWTTETFYATDAALADNTVSDTIPPDIGASRYSSGYLKLQTLMLNEVSSLADSDRATNAIPVNMRYNFPEFDQRGVNRRNLKTDIDIGPVFFDGTTPGDPSEPITTYTIQSVTMSGIPNTLRSIGQTASLIAMIQYSNGRRAYGGNDSGSEPVIWSSSNPAVVKIDQKGNITALALTPGNSYVTISVATKRNTAGGTPATDSRPVRVTGQYSYLNISSEYQNYLAQFISELAEHDISISLADVNSSGVKSSSFQRAFKSAWNSEKATQITDLTSSSPTFTTSTGYNSQGYIPSKNAAANINFQNRANGDVFPVIYSWNLSASEIKALTGYDLSSKTLNANLADDLFKSLRIDFQGAGKVFQVVGGSGVSAKDAYSNQALTLTKSDGNKGVNIQLTAYLANVNADGSNSDGSQLMGSGSRKLLVVPDGNSDGAITGSMWLIQKGSSPSLPDTPDTPDVPSTPDTPDDSGSKSGSGGGGGCNTLSLGILAVAVIFRRKR